jgi:cytochrome c biogenesis protein CcmG, thiol:disulfide interchange protein DsbE
LLVKVAEDKRIRIIGIDYKDEFHSASRFLGTYGNPFDAVGADLDGRGTAEWKLNGLPSTFVINRDGRMSFDFIQPVTPLNVDAILKQEIEKALN